MNLEYSIPAPSNLQVKVVDEYVWLEGGVGGVGVEFVIVLLTRDSSALMLRHILKSRGHLVHC